MGLAYLASSLLEYRKDLEIEIIDGFILDYDEYYRKISEIDADLVGVTSALPLLDEALRIPRLVGEKKSRFIIGGPGVTNLDSSKLYDSGYSVICYGEGERTIVELLNAFMNKLDLKDVKGISFLHNGAEIRTPPRDLIVNLDDLPFPARDLLNMEKYVNTWKEKMGVALTQIISSRGCQFSCRFCDRSIFGGKIRFMSPTRVIEEMKLLFDKYNVEMVFFEEDLFTLNRKRVLNFCDAMIRDLPGKRWGAYARVETVNREMLFKMKQAGCTDLVFGIESGSQKILDFLGKGITVKQIERAFNWVNEAGIDGGMFLIIGVPGETQQDIDKTKRLIAECQPKMINISFLTPIPGTEMFEMTKHLIRDGVNFYNFEENYESVYRKDVFEKEPVKRLHEIMDFYLNTFGEMIDPRLSLYDGTALAY